MLRRGTCIGFLPDAGCGLIYADEAMDGSHIVFVHFRDIEPMDGWQGLNQGDRVAYVYDEEKGALFHRANAASGESGDFVRVIDSNQHDLLFCTVEELADKSFQSKGKTYVVTGDIPQGWQFESLSEDVLFYNCRWQGKANFSNVKINGSLVFLGCVFKDAFTLKEARISGAIHMEGCDFSGAGGVSFRGLQAKALYLDFGVKGSRDMIWLNEMYIENDVVIGGVFEGSVQVMRIQDDRVSTQTAKENTEQDRACFQRLFIGKEFYKSQNINRTILYSSLDIQGLSNGEYIEIEYAEINALNMTELDGGVSLSCCHSKILGSVFLSGHLSSSGVAQIDFRDSYIEGHLSVRDMIIKEELNLDDATVERVVRLHHVAFSQQGGLKLARLSVNRFVMDDYSALYGDIKPSIWKNSRFGMLWREKQKASLIKGDEVELVQEYVLLKHLLGQEGQLRLEDEAFYNMRKTAHWYQDMSMLLFNYVFGWGVRLQNILISVLFVLLVYTVVYGVYFPSLEGLDAFQLSIQAMFMAFFGEMVPKVVAGGALSWLVLSESVLGVIFVTVFVGAYVRKLLR